MGVYRVVRCVSVFFSFLQTVWLCFLFLFFVMLALYFSFPFSSLFPSFPFSHGGSVFCAFGVVSVESTVQYSLVFLSFFLYLV